ncbi:MAG: cellulase family glycosylhydrolase, partial [Bacteroidota bacterium]|nr:cellulase family glycosylhydrolase [Bacteroidota bacterium]
MKQRLFLLLSLSLLMVLTTVAQTPKQNLVYVDNKGVLRYTANKMEATFFGVNYTVPFAYGYRSHKALGVDPEKAIDADVHHMARLGLNAFRVHVWDVEISDSLGNLLENEHLRLFDYLLFKLKQQNIKILLTPIAFWGSGYPEPDVKTNGFASVYGKEPSVVREEAIKAQENYLKQFFRHVNPYTKSTYRDDPDVIAMEINNEPHHSGSREKTTAYVNRMVTAVKSTGWTKPIFYNISESPSYAGAVAAAKVDGFSFQWYPTGLVANQERRGNFLPNVDHYHIPFIDSLPAFANRARMVYEFDAGDVMQPIMYPAMARSYRTAGFQWATQFAYDPLYTAYGNTEYQTHYLNLVYTPAKAISLLIAAKAFHRLPRGKTYGTYPADTTFGAFRVSYREQLSEMNTEEAFYYTSSTSTKPANSATLKHIAGTGSSPVVQYNGTGAYFLDKVAEGAWRLEIFPDAVAVNDPFEKASPKKTVTRIQWRTNRMQLRLPELTEGYIITGATTGNAYKSNWKEEGNYLEPGVYFITNSQSPYAGYTTSGVAYYAPPSSTADPVVYHQPLPQVTPLQSFPVIATVAGIDTVDNIFIELRHSVNQWKTLPMQYSGGYQYRALVPADFAAPGLIDYRIMVRRRNGDTFTFPGGFQGDPYA